MGISIEITGLDNKRWSWQKEIASLKWTKGIPGGCLTCEMDIPRKSMTNEDIQILHEVKVSDESGSLWEGRIEDAPKESTSNRKNIAVKALGWFAHSQDDFLVRRYVDSRLEEWKQIERSGLTNPDQAALDASDNYGADYGTEATPHLSIWCNSGRTFAQYEGKQFVCRLPKYYYDNVFPTNQYIKKITADYQTNYDNNHFRARIFAYNGTSWTQEWENNIYGGSSGGLSLNLPANTREILFRLQCINSFSYPFVSAAWFAILSNIKTYGTTTSTPLYVSDVLKDMRAACPKWAADDTQITTTSTALDHFIFDEAATPQDIINKAAAQEGQFYNVGIWKDKILKSFVHDKTKIDYYADMKECEISNSGESLTELFNKAYTSYEHPIFGRQYRKRTSTSQYLSNFNLTRAEVLQSSSKNTTTIDSELDTFLTNHNRLKFAGSISAFQVRDGNGATVPFQRIEVGKNLRIQDIGIPEGTASDVLDGKTTFRVMFVEVDHNQRKAKITLDTPKKIIQIFEAVPIENVRPFDWLTMRWM